MPNIFSQTKEQARSKKRIANYSKQFEKELRETVSDKGINLDEMKVTIGATVIIENCGICIENIPLELIDLVIEFRTWEDKIICHRGVGKANKYWYDIRKKLVDRRTVVPAPLMPDFKGNLRPYQNEGVKVGMMTEEGIFQLPTGSGKTVMGIALASALKQRTLWIVPNTLLLNQTAASVRKFLGIEPGIIGGGINKTNSDFVVATFQSLPPRIHELREGFGLLILDESHRMAADTLLDLCAVIPARYRFGFTATSRRRDNRHKILELILGPKIMSPSTLSMASYLAFPIVNFVHTGIDSKPINWTSLLAAIRDDEQRNAIIAIMAISESVKSERILILTRLVEHVKILSNHLTQASKVMRKNYGIDYKRGIYNLTGESKPAAREAALQGFRSYGGILVATEELCGEGFDLPQLDSMFLAMPAGEIRAHQRAGRLMRLFKAEQDKNIFDFVDSDSISENLAEVRKNEYLSMALNIGDDIFA